MGALNLVPGAGLEPARHKREILSLLCLPFHHPGITELKQYYTTMIICCQSKFETILMIYRVILYKNLCLGHVIPPIAPELELLPCPNTV